MSTKTNIFLSGESFSVENIPNGEIKDALYRLAESKGIKVHGAYGNYHEYPCIGWDGDSLAGLGNAIRKIITIDEFITNVNNFFPTNNKLELSGKYTATIFNHSQTVAIGCQTIPFDKLKEIHNFISKPTNPEGGSFKKNDCIKVPKTVDLFLALIKHATDNGITVYGANRSREEWERVITVGYDYFGFSGNKLVLNTWDDVNLITIDEFIDRCKTNTSKMIPINSSYNAYVNFENKTIAIQGELTISFDKFEALYTLIS